MSLLQGFVGWLEMWSGLGKSHESYWKSSLLLLVDFSVISSSSDLSQGLTLTFLYDGGLELPLWLCTPVLTVWHCLQVSFLENNKHNSASLLPPVLTDSSASSCPHRQGLGCLPQFTLNSALLPQPLKHGVGLSRKEWHEHCCTGTILLSVLLRVGI